MKIRAKSWPRRKRKLARESNSSRRDRFKVNKQISRTGFRMREKENIKKKKKTLKLNNYLCFSENEPASATWSFEDVVNFDENI